jgi:hypothetical protein
MAIERAEILKQQITAEEYKEYKQRVQGGFSPRWSCSG